MIKNRSGFTLVEIMIVVLIIALLTSIAVPNIIRARISAHDSAAKASLRAISTAMETYLSQNSVYPTNITSLTSPNPPYLQVNYFSGVHDGFTYTLNTLTNVTYSATAYSTLGNASFTISTGAVLVEN